MPDAPTNTTPWTDAVDALIRSHVAIVMEAEREAEADAERRIVEWLRERQAAVLPGSEGSALLADTFRHAAACIENGAHRA